MDIRHLKYFTEVARHRSFSRAAQELHVSQSTVSKTVKELETEMNTTLLNRNSKAVQLTDMGELFYIKAQQIVTSFDTIASDLDKSSGKIKGKIKIGLPPITGATIFAKLLGKFKRMYPDIEIVLFEYGSKTIEKGIHDGSLDIGLVCSEVSSDLYDIINFTKDPLKVVVTIDHPLAGHEEVKFAALANENFILFRKDFTLHDEIMLRCKIAGFQPKVIVETSQRELMLQIVTNKLGITLLPGEICKELDRSAMASISIDDPQIFLQLSFISNKKRYLSNAAILWLDFVRNYLNEYSVKE